MLLSKSTKTTCLPEGIQTIIIQLNDYLLLSLDETEIILTEIRNSWLAGPIGIFVSKPCRTFKSTELHL